MGRFKLTEAMIALILALISLIIWGAALGSKVDAHDIKLNKQETVLQETHDSVIRIEEKLNSER